MPLGPCSMNHFPGKKTIARGVLSFGYLVVSWEISLPSIHTEVGTSSNATPTTPHSQLNTHFELTTLDLLSTNYKSNHNPPLALDYKYDKQRKKGGLKKGEKKREEGVLENARESRSDKKGEKEK